MAKETLGELTASSTGTAVTAGGSVDTFGSWVDLGSASINAEFLQVFITGLDVRESFLVEVGTGVGPTELFTFTFYGNTSGNTARAFSIPIPTVSSGTKFQVRCKCTAPSDQISVALVVDDIAEVGDAVAIESIGDSGSVGTNVEGNTTTANTLGTWVDIGTTGIDYDYLLICLCMKDGTSITGTNPMLVTLNDATGGAGTDIISEVPIEIESSEGSVYYIAGFVDTISSGTTISAAVRSATTTDDWRDVWISLVGVNYTYPTGGGGSTIVSQGMQNLEGGLAA